MPEEKQTISLTIENTKDLEPLYATLYRVAIEPDAVTLMVSHAVAGQTISSYALVMPPEHYKVNSESVVNYFERLSALFTDVKASQESSFGLYNPRVYYGSLLDFAHYGDTGQIRMSWIDARIVAAIHSQGLDPKKVTAGRGVCMFDCPIAMQLGIIKKLYMGL
jgi:hypothetical protein